MHCDGEMLWNAETQSSFIEIHQVDIAGALDENNLNIFFSTEAIVM